METATQSVKTILREPSFEGKVIEALRLVTAMEGSSGSMDEDWFTQTVRGFINVALEAAEATERPMRDMFFATIVPGILAEATPPTVLLRSSTTFLSLLGNQLVVQAPQVDRTEVSTWFARFAGSYIEDLYRACLAAHDP